MEEKYKKKTEDLFSMELSYTYLRTKEVVNVVDGRKLGRVSDVVFCYPENRVTGIVAPGGKSFSFRKSEHFIEMKNIVKIGDDVVLVNIGCVPKPGKKSRFSSGENPSATPLPSQGRRSYEEYE